MTMMMMTMMITMSMTTMRADRGRLGKCTGMIHHRDQHIGNDDDNDDYNDNNDRWG